MYNGTQGVDAREVLVTTDGRYIAVNDRYDKELDGVPTYKVYSGSEKFHIPQDKVEDIVFIPAHT